MRRFLIPALLAATVAVPAVAAAPLHSFSQDGDSYEYTASRAADGAVLLVGRVTNTGDNFKLRVAGRAVTGRIGARQGSFTVSPKLKARVEAEVQAEGPALAAN